MSINRCRVRSYYYYITLPILILKKGNVWMCVWWPQRRRSKVICCTTGSCCRTDGDCWHVGGPVQVRHIRFPVRFVSDYTFGRVTDRQRDHRAPQPLTAEDCNETTTHFSVGLIAEMETARWQIGTTEFDYARYRIAYILIIRGSGNTTVTMMVTIIIITYNYLNNGGRETFR